MLAMRAGMERVSELLAPGCSLASINGPSLVVVAGPTDAIARTAERAGEAGIAHRLLETSHAFHSAIPACRRRAIPRRMRGFSSKRLAGFGSVANGSSGRGSDSPPARGA
jgi:hypothetical protein